LLSRLLTSKGNDFIVLKAPYVATRFLGSIDRRQFYDLDILIRREDLQAVERLLCDCGYKRKSTVLFSRTLTTHFTHALDFAKSNVALDLHWLLSANAAHSLDYNSIWRERQAFALQKHTFYVLSEEYEVVFSLISIFKDLERGVARLKAFVDLYFILASVSHALTGSSFSRIASAREFWKYRSMCCLYSSLCSSALIDFPTWRQWSIGIATCLKGFLRKTLNASLAHLRAL